MKAARIFDVIIFILILFNGVLLCWNVFSENNRTYVKKTISYTFNQWAKNINHD